MERLTWIIPVSPVQSITGVLKREKQRVRERGDVTTEAEADVMQSEDGGRARSLGMQAAARNWKNQEKRFFPRASQRNAALHTHLDF